MKHSIGRLRRLKSHESRRKTKRFVLGRRRAFSPPKPLTQTAYQAERRPSGRVSAPALHAQQFASLQWTPHYCSTPCIFCCTRRVPSKVRHLSGAVLVNHNACKMVLAAASPMFAGMYDSQASAPRDPGSLFTSEFRKLHAPLRITSRWQAGLRRSGGYTHLRGTRCRPVTATWSTHPPSPHPRSNGINEIRGIGDQNL